MATTETIFTGDTCDFVLDIWRNKPHGKIIQCGTVRGATRHYNRGEGACVECKAAMVIKKAEDKMEKVGQCQA